MATDYRKWDNFDDSDSDGESASDSDTADNDGGAAAQELCDVVETALTEVRGRLGIVAADELGAEEEGQAVGRRTMPVQHPDIEEYMSSDARTGSRASSRRGSPA